MKKLLTILFALMMISTFSFGAGNLFTWKVAPVNTDWQNPLNWTKTALPYAEAPGTSTWPGQFATGDWAAFTVGGFVAVTNVPNITLGRLESSLIPTQPATQVLLLGSFDGATITMSSQSPQLYALFQHWTVKIDEGCWLDLNGLGSVFTGTPPNRIKLVCSPGAHVWHKNQAVFNPADYSNMGTTCDYLNKGFVLQAGINSYTFSPPQQDHAEFIQQESTNYEVKGWVQYLLDDGLYHFFCAPITSDNLLPTITLPNSFGTITWTHPNAEFMPNNVDCRKANSLCVFDGDYVRKFSNGATWDNWLGSFNCFNPMVDIQTGRGYEYYGYSGNINNSGIYQFYGKFNSEANPLYPLPNVPASYVKLPITALGWNFIGNPFPSAIKFDEVSGAPTAGVGWSWNYNYVSPVVYWWDNALGMYRYYDWLNGGGSPVPEQRTVPRSQGFFVNCINYSPNTYPATSDISIGNLARIFRGNQQIAKSVISNRMNIVLNDASGKMIDDANIGFQEEAIGTEFNHLMDAYKFWNEITNPSQIYFKTSDNVDVVMKTLKAATGNVMYPLYMKVINSGTFSLDVKNVSSFSANTGIILKDNKTNTTVDLKVNSTYTFTATAGDDDARFSLYFTDVLYGINNLENTAFNVYSYDNSIFIQNNDPKSSVGTVIVYDMIGKQMMRENLNSSITRINTNLNTGFYIVSVKTDKGVYNQKVYIN